MFTTTVFARLARERAIAAMIERGLRCSPQEVFDELQAVVDEFGSNDDRHYNRLLQRLPAEATAGINPELLVTAGVIAYHETKWRELRLGETTRELLEDLSRSDVKLGVITAGLTRKQMEKILRLGMDRYLDPGLIFITDQVGVAKTNPELYAMAARAAGVEPSAAMHVGDHPLRDVETAKRAGLLATWHEGSGKYAQLQSSIPADHRVVHVEELRPILAEHYGVAL